MLFRLIVTLSALASLSYAECPTGCNEPVAIYEDLKCLPIYAKPDDCCPAKYDCSNVEERPADKCTLRGKTYAVGEKIPSDETYANCQVGCSCIEGETVRCAILDCAEWLVGPAQPGHHYIYEHKKCCSVGQKTAPYSTCKVDDQEYKEGQRFDAPGKRCHSCICQKGFKGKFVEPFCEKTFCIEELDSADKIKKNCAPAYMGERCCPFNWICADDMPDTIIPTTKTVNPDMQCKYGTKTLNVGDKFDRDEIRSAFEKVEVRCECRIPPFVTCSYKQVFDLQKAPEHIRNAFSL